MEMETLLHNNTNTLDLVASLVVETALCAQKSLICLLLLIGSQSNGTNMLTSLMEAEERFPFADLTSVREPVAEHKDAGETDVTESSDDDDDDDDEDEDDDEEDNESEGEESDNGADSDDDGEANGDSESDEDDDDNDEDDDSDDDEENNDEDEDDEEEEKQPPPKKKK